MAGIRWIPGLCTGVLFALAGTTQPAVGEELPAGESQLHTGPTIRVHYRELLNRQPFSFDMNENGRYKKPAGQLSFTFPENEFPSEGLDEAFRTYCAEPLVPIYAGRDYTFTVEPFGKPSDFDLPDTEEGRATAARRTAFVRELYGRHYVESGTGAESDIGAPAFQIALWELLREQEFPEGPKPFNLSTGTFRAALDDKEVTPAHVQRAQEYLDDLTGDDAPFIDNEFFTGMELIRLEDVESMNGMPIQAQILPRTTPISSSGGLGEIAGLGSLGGLGGGGGLGSGLGMAGAPMLGGGGTGGGGSGGGRGGPGLGLPLGGGGVPGNNNGNGGGNPGPQIGVDPPPTNPPTNPPTVTPPTEKPPVDPPPVDPPPVDPPPVDPPPPKPVPAPPGVVLGLVAGVALLGRRFQTRKSAGSTP